MGATEETILLLREIQKDIQELKDDVEALERCVRGHNSNPGLVGRVNNLERNFLILAAVALPANILSGLIKLFGG